MADVQQNILINIDVESGKVTSELDQIDKKINDLGKGANLQSFKSIRAEIAAAREEAVRLALAIDEAEAAGQNVDALSARYTEVTQRAAELRDAVDKTNASIGNARPDNRLQGLITIAQGAALAVQGVAGAFTILGVDAETANVALAKLQGIIAITSSLSSIDEIVDGYKDLTRNINFATIATQASNVATAAATVIQRAFTGSVVATGTAFKVLRAAIISTGIGALVVAIGLTVAALVKLTDQSEKAEQATKDLGDEIDRIIGKYDEESRALDRNTKLQVAIAKARGASQTQINNITANNLRRQLREALAAEEQLDNAIQKRRNDGLVESAEEIKKNNERLTQLRTEIKNVRLEIDLLFVENSAIANQAGLDAIEEQKDAAVKAAEDTQRAQERASEEAKQKRINDLEEIAEFTDQVRIEDQRARQTDLQNEIDEVNRKYKRLIDLARTYRKDTTELEKLRAAEINRITTQALFSSARSANELVAADLQRVTDFVFAQIDRFRKKSIGTQKAFLKENNEVAKLRFTELVDIVEQTQKNLAEFNLQETIDRITKLTFSTDPGENKRRQDQIVESVKSAFQLGLADITRAAEDLKSRRENEFQLFKIDLDISEAEKKLESLAKSLDQTLKALNSGPAGKVRLESQKAIEQGFILQKTLRETLNQTLATIDEGRRLAVQQIDKRYADLTEQEKRSSLQYRREIEAIDKVAFELRVKNIGQAGLLLIETDREIAKQRILVQKSIQEQTSMTSQVIGDQVGGSFTRDIMGENARKQFDQSLLSIKAFYDEQKNLENLEFQRQISDKSKTQLEIERITREHYSRLVQIESEYNNQINTLNQAQLDSRLMLLEAIGGAVGRFGETIDGFANKQTAVGKAAAIAEIAIQTATGFARGLQIAQQTAAAAGPGAAFALPIFYAQQVAIVLSAVNKARQILEKVPGPSSAGGASTAPTPPQAINSSVFRLPPEAQNVRVVNQQSQVVRAYITNEDLRSAQEKRAFLDKLSNF
jgi:hypothetical protein